MARRGIVVELVANVRDFLRGTDDAAAALEDVGSELDTVARDGDKAADNLGKDFREIARDADSQFRKVGQSADKSFRKVEDESEKASDVVKDEARQSAAEFGSSFDGSAESVADSFRDIASAAGAELGGIAGYAATGVAAGVGLLYAEWQKVRDKINEDARRIGDNLREAFTSGVDPYQVLVDELWVESRDKFGQIVDLAEEFGLNTEDALRAHVGDQVALQRVLDVLRPIAESQTATADEAQRALDIIADTGGSALTKLVRGLQGGETAAQKAAGHLEDWNTYLSAAGEDALPAVVNSLRDGSVYAEEIAYQARITDGYWSGIERRVRNAGTALPGQVRAEVPR